MHFLGRVVVAAEAGYDDNKKEEKVRMAIEKTDLVFKIFYLLNMIILS